MALIKLNTRSIPDDSVTPSKVSQNLGRRNIIINGGMQVWQRATSATTVTNSSYGTVDRFRFWENTDGAYTAEQSTDVPSGQGFSYSTKLQVTTADTSLTASQYAQFAQRIEAQNLQQLCYGTSEAKTVTASFWVKSSKTGNYSFSLYKPASGHTAYMYYKSFTINTANTWEKKTITVSPTAGSTSFITASGGGIDTSTSNGMEVYISLAMGSNYQGATDNSWSTNTSHYMTSSDVNWLDSTSNNFYLTGVQLEVGDTATEFEHRSFGEELAACQRYFYNPQYNLGGSRTDYACNYSVSSGNNGWITWIVPFPVTMRANSTFSHSLTNAKTVGSAAPGNGVDGWSFYVQNQGYTGISGNGDMSTLSGDGKYQGVVGTYYVSPSSTSCSHILVGNGCTFQFNAEL
jgi:hypothetical protein